MTNNLIKSISIEAFIARRAVLEEKLKAAHAAFREAEEALDAIKSMAQSSHVYFSFRYLFSDYQSSRKVPKFLDPDGVKDALKVIDRELWDVLFRESGLRTFMDSKARNQWTESIQNDEVSPLTAENIKATFAELYNKREEFFERGVIEVFKSLSWDYKSNSPVRFGRRIVIEHLMTSYGRGLLNLNSRVCDRIDDLVRVFCLLDGKPEPDHRNSTHAQLWKVRPRSNGPPLFPHQVVQKGDLPPLLQ